MRNPGAATEPTAAPQATPLTEAGYAKVQTDLVLMRRSGELPYGWLADNTRWQRKPTTFNISVELDAIEPRRLRTIAQRAIEHHLPRKQFEALEAAEASERELLRMFVAQAGGSH